jgi:hypothetical protein
VHRCGDGRGGNGTFTATGATLKTWLDRTAAAPTTVRATAAFAGRVFRKFCIVCRSLLISV